MQALKALVAWRLRAEVALCSAALATATLLGGSTVAPAVSADSFGATHLDVWGSWGTFVAGVPLDFEVSAEDAGGSLAQLFTDGVHFTSSDPLASLPVDYGFVGPWPFGDNGYHWFTAILFTAGRQTITATDTANPLIKGTLTLDVQPGDAVSLVETIPPAMTAGAPGSVSVVPKDVWGNFATGYTGTVHFSSNDPAAVLPADYTFSPPDTQALVPGAQFIATLKTAGTKSITVTDVAHTGLTATRTTTVTAAPHLWIDLGATRSAGASGYSYEVQALDASGSVATGYSGTVHFTSSDPQADLPDDYTFQASDHGDAWVTGLTLKTVGQRTVTAVDVANNLIRGTAVTWVTPGPARSVDLSGMPSGVMAGVPVTVHVTSFDGFGNVKNNYLGGSVTFASSDPQAVLPPVYQFVAGDYGRHAFTVELRTAGDQTLSVTVGSYSDSVDVRISPAGTAKFSISGGASLWVAGMAGLFTVAAEDVFSNATSGYHGTVHLTSSDAKSVLPADYGFLPADHGSHAFSVTLKTAGSQSVTSTDTATASITGSRAGILVSPGPATHLAVGGLASPIAVGTPGSATVTAFDAYGNTVTSYAGSVHFSSSDAAAVLPANYTFLAGDHGSRAFAITLRTVGTQSVTATDIGTPSIAGSQAGILVQAIVPGAPTGVSATPGNAQAIVSWTAPVSDGGSPITGYTVTSAPDSRTCSPTPATGTTCTVTGLTNGAPYAFTVTARNVVGTGPASSPSGPVTPTAPAVVRRPDGRIRLGTSGAYAGNNVYNTTGAGQSKTGSAKRGKTITFGISIQNDGTNADSFKIKATGSATSRYTLKYFYGAKDITAKVVAGTYRTTSLAPGAAYVITAKVTVKATAATGSKVTRLVTISSAASTAKKDVVKLVAKRS